MSDTKKKPLDKQVIVVTGASSGIGLCTALLAAERGAKVVLVARSDETLADAVAVIEERGGHALAVHCDVASRDAVDAAVFQAIGAFGRIDTWVNNAGVSIYGRLTEVSEEDSRRLFDVNFWGVVNGSLAALPALQASGGTLVNVGSEVSEAVVPLQGMYSASKHAVKGFTDALRVELEHVEKAPVQVVLIQPTAVETPFPEHARNYMDWEPKLPEPRIAAPQVAEAILQAAVDGGRDVKVGAMAAMNTMMSNLLPALADRLSARQAGNQQKNIPPQRPAGTLYEAGGEGRIAGKP